MYLHDELTELKLELESEISDN